MMRARTTIPVAILAAAAVGCTTAHSATTDDPPRRGSAVPLGMHRMPDGSLMPDSEMSMKPGPSASAAMICSTEIHHTLQRNLGIPAVPVSDTRWVNDIYTCTYHLDGGDLIASVQDAGTVTAGRRYFTTIRTHTPGLRPITGLQSLGLPGYTDNRGIVLFLKDGKTLEVDATRLPTRTGRFHQTPAAVAYGLAADVLACWSEH